MRLCDNIIYLFHVKETTKARGNGTATKTYLVQVDVGA